MCPTYMYGADGDCTYQSSEREIDPADYPGLTHAWFEAVGWGYGPDLLLVDAAGTEYARLTLQDLPGTSDRQRVEFTLNAATTKYYFKTLGTSGDFYFRTVRIILDLVNSNSVRVQIPMLDGDQSTSGYYPPAYSDLWAFNWTAEGTDYAYGGTLANYRYAFRPFLLTKANWQTVDHWTLEVIGSTPWYDEEDLPDPPEADQGLSVALFNRTKNLMVTGAEIHITSSSVPLRAEVDFANDAVNFDDGDYFEVRIKQGFESDYSFAAIYSVNLYCKVINAWKCEVHNQIGYAASTWIQDNVVKFLYEADKYSAATPWYFEQGGSEWGDGMAFTALIDCGATDQDPKSQFKYPTTVSTTGSWTNPNNIKVYDGADAVGNVIDVGPVATITLGGFNFTPAAFTQPIFGVQGHLVGVAWGEKLTVDMETTGLIESHLIDNEWNWQPLPLPAHWEGVAWRYTYDFSFDRAWVAADFGAGFSVKLTVNLPAVDPSALYTDFMAFAVSTGRTVARLDYSIPADGRYSESEFQRSADISGDLTDDDRYWRSNFNDISNGTVGWYASCFLVGLVTGTQNAECTSVAASIDSETLLITGTGTGIGTQWRVIRVSDSAVMDSGSGSTAAFSFVGAYDVEYQLQFGAVTP